MASRYVLPIRRAQALEALNKAGRTLAKRFDVDPPDLTPHKDPELDRIVQIENMATFLDGLAKATKPEKVEEQAEEPESIPEEQPEVALPQEDEVTAVSSAPPPPQDLESQENEPEVPASPVTEVQTPEVQVEAPKPAPVKSSKATTGTQAKGASKGKTPQSAATKGKASKSRK